nr:unnamed protein product [Spirometra erinaceieuropaei]
MLPGRDKSPHHIRPNCTGLSSAANRCSGHSRRSVVYVEVTKRRNEPLGIALRLSSSGRCIVGRIMYGGLIHKTDAFHVHDEIIEIDGHSLEGVSTENIQRYLLASEGKIVFKICPSKKAAKPPCQMFVRAMFDYNPLEDDELPLSGIGQAFEMGDILELVDCSDFTWWQARKQTADPDSPARLIPSADLQERRVLRDLKGFGERCSNGNYSADGLPCHSSPTLLNLLHSFSKSTILANDGNRIGAAGAASASSSSGSKQQDFLHSPDEKSLDRPPANNRWWFPFSRISFRAGRRRGATPNGSSGSGLASRSRSTDALDESWQEHRHQQPARHAHSTWRITGGEPSGQGLGTSLNHLHRTCSHCSSNPQTNCSSTQAPITRRKKANDSTPFLFSELPFQTYEEVILHPAFRRKSLVLLGAHGVGRRTLRRSLVVSRPDIFANTVSHTTRKPEPYEIDGVHFYFVQKEEMASDILNKEFLEYGKRKNILFGTRLDSVREVMRSGRLPVLDVEPKSLRILRSAEFAPFVIFIAPPCLKLLIRDSTHDTLNSVLAKLNRESEIMEYVYRPYIDKRSEIVLSQAQPPEDPRFELFPFLSLRS